MDVRAVVQRLCALLRLAGPEHGDEDVRQPVRDARRAIRARLLGEVERRLAELVLPPPVRAEAAFVEYFDARALVAGI